MAGAGDRSGRSVALEQFLEEIWLPVAERTVRPSTFVSYRGHVRNHIDPALGKIALAKLEPRQLNAFYSALASSRSCGVRGLSPATVRRIHATLHRALRDAVRWGYISQNPASQCDPPRAAATGGREMATWSASELKRFLVAVENDELRALWVLLATTGLRRGEALGLRWSDVDLERREAAVRQTVVAVGAEIVLSRPKTRRGERVVALDPHTVGALERHLRRARDGGRLAMASDYVFADADGGPVAPAHVSKRFRQIVAAAGLPEVRLHDLRHTHATIALQAGIHPKIVSERLGHANISITLDIYSHVLPHLQHEAATIIGDVIFGASST